MVDLAQLPRHNRGVSLRARRPTHHQRYMAFLSYSHQDSAIADWLHETLEEFRVPPRLVGKLTDQGPIPKRLTPIFRDRRELAAAPDLGEEIEEAIAGSRFQIVLCSPAAAKSRWINEEIACFKRVHRQDRVLAVIVDGEPFASDIAGREDEECFPPALRTQYDARGRPTSQRAEPIAADLREQADGRRMGMLKLAAGMLGVGLDDLVQREAQRRHRRLYMITAASVAGMLFTSGLAYTAIEARDEARDQRREAEGLIGFMLGDLRKKLEPVGRLDVLDSVGGRALAYYEGQDKQSLSDESLAQRSKALTLMGEIAASRGDFDGALRRYREALAGTAEALRRFPDDPQRMFDHAQSVYWVGTIAMERGRIDEAAASFREYRRLADRMVAVDPNNPKWQLEVVYASSNLGIVQHEQANYAEAAATFQASVGAMEGLTAAEPANAEYRDLMLEALAYHSDALDGAGRIDQAIRQRQRQLDLLAPHLALPKPDADLRQKAMIANMALSRLLFERGKGPDALRYAEQAVELGRRLTTLEPNNADWLGRATNAILNDALLQLRSGRMAEAAAATNAGCDNASRLMARDPTVVYWIAVNRTCLQLRAELAANQGSPSDALYFARQVLDGIRSGTSGRSRDRFAPAEAQKLIGDIQWRTGDKSAAMESWKAGLAAWPKDLSESPRQKTQRGEMLRGIGERAEGVRIARELAAKGYRQSLSNRAKV